MELDKNTQCQIGLQSITAGSYLPVDLLLKPANVLLCDGHFPQSHELVYRRRHIRQRASADADGPETDLVGLHKPKPPRY